MPSQEGATMIRQSQTRRRVLQTGALGLGAWVAGCGRKNSPSQQVEESVEWARANLPRSTPDIVNAAAKEGHLTLTMLNQGGNADILKRPIEGFNKRYPFITVEATAQSTLQLLNKFNAELNAKKGTTDYINFPGNLHTTGLLEKQGAILPFVISQDEAFPAPAKRSGLWYAWRIEHSATAYRKGALSPEELKLIRTFEGLGDPRFKNRIAIGNIPNSTTASGVYVLMYKADPKLWQGLVANKPRVKTSGPALVDGLLAGEHDIAVLAGSISFIGAARSGAPMEFGISSPYPPVYTPGGISALAPHPNAAKLWQDWVMSAEGQRILVDASGLGAARKDLGVKAWSEQQPWYFQDDASVVEIDWEDFAQKQPEMNARFGKDMQKG
jgi:ABC-type Fe3+ transport system substrate-binding protein